MKTIPNLFQHNPNHPELASANVNPASAWVVAGEGEPQRMLDGVPCLVRGRRLFVGVEATPGNEPLEFVETEHDTETNVVKGWMPVSFSDPDNRYLTSAWANLVDKKDGTYELVGPKILDNPEGLSQHLLIPHSNEVLGLPKDTPRNFEGLHTLMTSPSFVFRGIVWHHPDGRMAKVKRSQF